MMIELRDRPSAEQWLGAGLCLMRLEPPAAVAVGNVAPWLLAAQAEHAALPPAAVVADVGRALLSGGGQLVPAPSIGDDRLSTVLRLYEDRVLGRIATEPLLADAGDALARLPPELRSEAVAAVLGNLLRRVGFARGVAVNPGVTRDLVNRGVEPVLQAGWRTLGQPGPTLEHLAAGYEDLVRSARHAGSLIADDDVFLLENFASLRQSANRLAVQQVVEAASELGHTLPRRIKHGAERHGPIPTQVEDDDRYPTGGFASVSTSGSLENLVTSELVYMDENPGPDDLDLFDVRYVEGELLYYTRDESVFVRARRVITFVLEPSLCEARFKDPGMRWQRIVLVLGSLLALVRRLSEWLQDDHLRFNVLFSGVGGAGGVLANERELCELLFREWIEKGMLGFSTCTPEEAFEQAMRESKTAAADYVVFGVLPTVPPPEKRVQIHGVDVSGPVPVLWRADEEVGDPARDEPWAGWVEMVGRLARRLV